MKSYLVSNIADRKHKIIYKDIGAGAIIDLCPSQHGWSDFENVNVGDFVYVIKQNLKVVLGYKVSKVVNGILLEDETKLANKVLSITDGDVKVVFGEPFERVGMHYEAFVRKNGIKNPKLNPETNQMYQGFNCAVF
jgi:hypothetical protein